ncbi:glycosyltransferase family 9 protein [Candidatus Woesearchaeota archaeon]|nr:glycosyltransferase family 9 protein [Candidatus Woesearchaeota archaeon]
MRILIIKLGAFGDVLRTTCILKGLKKKYNAEILWFTKEKDSELLLNNEFIDKVITDAKKLGEYDLVVSLDDEAGKIVSKLKRKKIIGCFDSKYTADSSEWFDMGLISRFGKQKADELKKKNKRTYQQILSEMLNVEIGEYVFNLTDEEKRFGEKLDGKIVGVNTGSGGRWSMKRLNVERTVELIKKILSLDVKVVLFGGPEEKERNKKILSKVDVIDAGCDNSVREFASLINQCDVLVTSDTLAMHLGIALKKKIVAFFGPTSAAEIELYGRGKKIISKSDCYCCYKKTNGDCDKYISVDEIFNAVKELM